ncbi:DUF4437 domain-containing protein [Micromonospora sp. NPDC047074]|uniref:cupin domain-containing protein n=1 Tax=Micromonospora sp. NPDC047074 TaxID=3154339 RepID=UPI0033FA07F0
MNDRPFIEFVQAQQLGWADSTPYHDVRPGTGIRVLSTDAGSGAASLLVRYPAGWQRPVAETLTEDEEFFVISGRLVVDGQAYDRYGYGHLPAGYFRSGMSAPDGAVVLTFFAGQPEHRAASTHHSELAVERVVAHIDGLAGQWGAGFNPKFPPGAGRKWLRRDPVTGDETWILGTMPLRNGTRPERHPVVEEMYLLSGELHGHVGVMRPGAYFWRPPEEWHGPFGSLTGNVMLFRTVGGPLSTVYDDTEVPFAWDPPSRPILPPDLAALPAYESAGCACY